MSIPSAQAIIGQGCLRTDIEERVARAENDGWANNGALRVGMEESSFALFLRTPTSVVSISVSCLFFPLAWGLDMGYSLRSDPVGIGANSRNHDCPLDIGLLGDLGHIFRALLLDLFHRLCISRQYAHQRDDGRCAFENRRERGGVGDIGPLGREDLRAKVG